MDSDYEFEPLPQQKSRKRKQMADENARDEVYSKFVQPDNARHEYKEFCNYFELLEKCESLPSMLHADEDKAVCLEDSGINQKEDLDSENDNNLISKKNKDNDALEKNIKNHESLTLIYRYNKINII